jgi:formylglycine-generating enzyme required for sulfatase activity
MSLALLAACAVLGAPAGVFRDAFRDGRGCGPEMVRVPAGAFRMGSPPGVLGARALEVPHRVELGAFAIGRHEVTNAEYARFLDEVENRDEEGLPFVDPEGEALHAKDGRFRPAPGAERHPVVGVSWRGALAYGRWLSRKTGRSYGLPTEAQWERAARVGTADAWPGGEAAGGPLNCAGPEGRLAPAGTHPADAHGVFDLLGNAWEWTLDCFALDFYFYAPRRDPRLLDPACLAPGIRGGSFQDSPEMCRPGYRVNFWWRGAPSIGFRVVRGGARTR